MFRMNSTLAQLLNSLSLKLNSPSVNTSEVTPANASATVVNPVANVSAPTLAGTSRDEQNSTIVSFATLQTELGGVRMEKSEHVDI